MLRTLATSLLRSGKVTQIQNCAGIFTTTRLRQNVDEENDTEARRPPNFEKSLNSVTLLGRVGVEPQVRGSEEHPVVVFSLATNFRYKKGEEYMSSTDWHNVAVFKPSLRESVHQNVSKGHRVLVQGRIMYGTVEDKMGQKRHTTTIVADDVIRISS